MGVGKEMPAFVRFDREYPYGEKAEAFNAVAAEVARTGVGVLMVSVGVFTWGDRMNNDLVVQQGYIDEEKELSYDDMDKMFPKFRFFPPKGGKPVDYESAVAVEAFMKFLRNEAGIEFSLPGCVKVLDDIAKAALKAPADALEKSKAAIADMSELDKDKAAYYIKVLEKEIAGPGHIAKEKARLEGLVAGDTLPKKSKDAMTLKINVLLSFF